MAAAAAADAPADGARCAAATPSAAAAAAAGVFVAVEVLRSAAGSVTVHVRRARRLLQRAEFVAGHVRAALGSEREVPAATLGAIAGVLGRAADAIRELAPARWLVRLAVHGDVRDAFRSLNAELFALTKDFDVAVDDLDQFQPADDRADQNTDEHVLQRQLQRLVEDPSEVSRALFSLQAAGVAPRALLALADGFPAIEAVVDALEAAVPAAQAAPSTDELFDAERLRAGLREFAQDELPFAPGSGPTDCPPPWRLTDGRRCVYEFPLCEADTLPADRLVLESAFKSEVAEYAQIALSCTALVQPVGIAWVLGARLETAWVVTDGPAADELPLAESGPLDDGARWAIASQIAKAAHALHRRGRPHGDLVPEALFRAHNATECRVGLGRFRAARLELHRDPPSIQADLDDLITTLLAMAGAAPSDRWEEMAAACASGTAHLVARLVADAPTAARREREERIRRSQAGSLLPAER